MNHLGLLFELRNNFFWKRKAPLYFLIIILAFVTYETIKHFLDEGQDTHIDIVQINNKEKSLILCKVIFTGYNERNRYGKPLKNIWAKVSPSLGTPQEINYQFTREHKSICDSYMIDPGEVILKNFSYKEGSGRTDLTRYSYEGGSLTWRLKKKDGLFEINPGEVIYIGHIYIAKINGEWRIRVVDKFDEVQQYYKNEFSELRTTLQKRLVQFDGYKVVHTENFWPLHR